LTLPPERRLLALLGICSRTIKVRWKGVKRSYRLLKPYPATPHTFREHLRKTRLDSRARNRGPQLHRLQLADTHVAAGIEGCKIKPT
jgi:hypothetical protein